METQKVDNKLKLLIEPEVEEDRTNRSAKKGRSKWDSLGGCSLAEEPAEARGTGC